MNGLTTGDSVILFRIDSPSNGFGSGGGNFLTLRRSCFPDCLLVSSTASNPSVSSTGSRATARCSAITAGDSNTLVFGGSCFFAYDEDASSFFTAFCFARRTSPLSVLPLPAIGTTSGFPLLGAIQVPFCTVVLVFSITFFAFSLFTFAMSFRNSRISAKFVTSKVSITSSESLTLAANSLRAAARVSEKDIVDALEVDVSEPRAFPAPSLPPIVVSRGGA